MNGAVKDDFLAFHEALDVALEEVMSVALQRDPTMSTDELNLLSATFKLGYSTGYLAGATHIKRLIEKHVGQSDKGSPPDAETPEEKRIGGCW